MSAWEMVEYFGRLYSMEGHALAARMDDQVVLFEPRHLAILPRDGTTGEDEAAFFFLVRQGELGEAFHRHLALDEVRFAGAAIARLTTVGEADAVSKQGVEHGLAFLRGSGLVQIGYGDC